MTVFPRPSDRAPARPPQPWRRRARTGTAASLRPLVLRAIAGIWLVSIVAGVVILLLPDDPKRPLLRAADWQVEGNFTNTVRPPASEVSGAILDNPASQFWHAWPHRPGDPPSRLVTRSFWMPSFLSVPYRGYLAEPGIELGVECMVTGARLPLSRGNAHETWVERIIHVDPSWCPSRVRLVAETDSLKYIVAVGTPFAISRLSWLKESVLSILVIHALAWVLLIAPGLGVVMLLARKSRPSVFGVVLATFVLAYGQFFLSYYLPLPGRVISAALVLLGLFAVPAAWRRFRADSGSAALLPPVGVAFVLSLFYVAGLYVGDVGAGSYDATYRFAPAVWSVDNQLPQVVAETVYQERPIKGLFGDWKVSDRPPLMSGVFLQARTAWTLLLARGDNLRLLSYFYQVTGIVLSTLWVIPVWWLLARTGVSGRDAFLVILFMAASGFLIFNSTYIWPKLIAGTLALAAYVLHDGAGRESGAAGMRLEVASGVLFGLALVAHGGVAFGIVPIVLLSVAGRREHRLRGLALPALAALMTLMPWSAWQRLEDPPGNALTKFAFAGTYGMESPTKSVTETVREAYGSLTFGSWLQMRWEALGAVIGVFQPPLVGWLWLTSMDWMGRQRLADFVFLFPSLRVAHLGWLMLVLPPSLTGRAGDSGKRRAFARWVVMGLSGVFLSVVLMWSTHINHTLSYVSVLLVFSGLSSAALLLGPTWFRRLVFGAQLSYCAVVWIWSPLREAILSPGYASACVLSAIALAFLAPAVPAPEPLSGEDDAREVSATA